ncbi:MAG: hypothetical protein KAW89_07745, partial [Armatimonadetes bacterium]|nr:hypothetical protein [Armatimonadota bacterium]
PLVMIQPQDGWVELLDESNLRCEDSWLRGWEHQLRRRLYIAEHFNDDQVTDRRLLVGYVSTTTGLGLQAERIQPKTDRGSYVWDSPVKEPQDLDKLQVPHTEVDYEATECNRQRAAELFEGLLDVSVGQSWWWSLTLTWDWAELRGLEQMMWDMVDDPEFAHAGMRRLMEVKLEWMDSLEAQGLLMLNNRNDYVGSGGLGFTEELPADGFDGKHVRLRDRWGFTEAQEAVGLSPQMWNEFVLEYNLPFMERCGLNCFGCCEPLADRLDILKERVPRLRRISISAWADREKAAESLGHDYIYSWKPNPAQLAAVRFNEDKVRSYIRETLEMTRGCVVEIVLKDTHTCNNQPERFDRWAQIAQEESRRAGQQ